MRAEKDCAAWQEKLSAHADGELSTTDAIAVARHLAECDACSTEFNNLLQNVKMMREQMPPLKAPADLRARVLADLAGTAIEGANRDRVIPTAHSARVWSGWLAAAGVVLAIGMSYMAGARERPRSLPTSDAVLTAHVRSLQPGHLTDVASTDQHTVKPWFTGKLDFSPAVVRLEPDGFPLVGGRLDYLAGRPVAALVYSRRAHIINVVTYPAASPGDIAPHLESKNGFQIASWTGGGMTYWVVSDLNADELRGFCALYRERGATP